MEEEKNQREISASNVSGDHPNHNQTESNLSLSQWLQPSRVPRSYLALLNEDSKSPANPPVDDVLETPGVSISGTCTARGVKIVHIDAANHSIRSEQASGSTSPNKSACKVKPSVRVQSCVDHETPESCGKVLVEKRSLDNNIAHPWSQNCIEKSRVGGEQSGKNNLDSSQIHRKFRGVRSRQPNVTRPRSYSSERERKQRIEDNIKALRELLPSPVEDTPESILNDVVAHVKLLQLQIKELSRSRLGGEPTSHPFVSIEGYGHYIHHEQAMNKPLEEIMAELLVNDPDTVTLLLESKGLYLMPLALVEGFCRGP